MLVADVVPGPPADPSLFGCAARVLGSLRPDDRAPVVMEEQVLEGGAEGVHVGAERVEDQAAEGDRSASAPMSR